MSMTTTTDIYPTQVSRGHIIKKRDLCPEPESEEEGEVRDYESLPILTSSKKGCEINSSERSRPMWIPHIGETRICPTRYKTSTKHKIMNHKPMSRPHYRNRVVLDGLSRENDFKTKPHLKRRSRSWESRDRFTFSKDDEISNASNIHKRKMNLKFVPLKNMQQISPTLIQVENDRKSEQTYQLRTHLAIKRSTNILKNSSSKGSVREKYSTHCLESKTNQSIHRTTSSYLMVEETRCMPVKIDSKISDRNLHNTPIEAGVGDEVSLSTQAKVADKTGCLRTEGVFGVHTMINSETLIGTLPLHIRELVLDQLNYMILNYQYNPPEMNCTPDIYVQKKNIENNRHLSISQKFVDNNQNINIPCTQANDENSFGSVRTRELTNATADSNSHCVSESPHSAICSDQNNLSAHRGQATSYPSTVTISNAKLLKLKRNSKNDENSKNYLHTQENPRKKLHQRIIPLTTTSSSSRNIFSSSCKDLPVTPPRSRLGIKTCIERAIMCNGKKSSHWNVSKKRKNDSVTQINNQIIDNVSVTSTICETRKGGCSCPSKIAVKMPRCSSESYSMNSPSKTKTNRQPTLTSVGREFSDDCITTGESSSDDDSTDIEGNNSSSMSSSHENSFSSSSSSSEDNSCDSCCSSQRSSKVIHTQQEATMVEGGPFRKYGDNSSSMASSSSSSFSSEDKPCDSSCSSQGSSKVTHIQQKAMVVEGGLCRNDHYLSVCNESVHAKGRRNNKRPGRSLTSTEISKIIAKDEEQTKLPSTHWVRRSTRQPSRSGVNAPHVRTLIDKLGMNDPEMIVLKMKKYINDPDTPCVVMDAVLDALESNTNCQALYIQNFNEGMRDEQVQHLLQILQQPSCSIWCLNIGETYKVKKRTWAAFTQGLRETKVTHMYASEHTISGAMKEKIREIIRHNRKKHNMHINPENLEVIVQCTHCWWNPINAKRLLPFIKNHGYEYLFLDKVGQGTKDANTNPSEF